MYTLLCLGGVLASTLEHVCVQSETMYAAVTLDLIKKSQCDLYVCI